MRQPNLGTIDKLRQKANALKTETYALYLAYRHPRTPWYAKVFAGLVAAYAFSPVDLIPDFIPVLGYLDDLILVPLGIALALKMVPMDVMAECRQQARMLMQEGNLVNWLAAAVIILIWVSLAALFIIWLIDLLK